MNQNFIHSSVLNVMPQAIATGLFDSLCTLQRPDGTLIDAGQPSGTFTDVFTNIPCMAPPEADMRITASEEKAESQIQAFSVLHILLNAYYPDVEAGVGQGWRAVVDGTNYDILGAEHDSQFQMTRLAVRFSAL